MRDFSVTVDIDAPPTRVWAVVRDVERWAEWTASIRSIERLALEAAGLKRRCEEA